MRTASGGWSMSTAVPGHVLRTSDTRALTVPVAAVPPGAVKDDGAGRIVRSSVLDGEILVPGGCRTRGHRRRRAAPGRHAGRGHPHRGGHRPAARGRPARRCDRGGGGRRRVASPPGFVLAPAAPVRGGRRAGGDRGRRPDLAPRIAVALAGGAVSLAVVAPEASGRRRGRRNADPGRHPVDHERAEARGADQPQHAGHRDPAGDRRGDDPPHERRREPVGQAVLRRRRAPLNASAPAVTGMLIRKAKRTAPSRSSPARRPAVIVMPERDTPGCSATAWPTPISTASRRVTSSTVASARRGGRPSRARGRTR